MSRTIQPPGKKSSAKKKTQATPKPKEEEESESHAIEVRVQPKPTPRKVIQPPQEETGDEAPTEPEVITRQNQPSQEPTKEEVAPEKPTEVTSEESTKPAPRSKKDAQPGTNPKPTTAKLQFEPLHWGLSSPKNVFFFLGGIMLILLLVGGAGYYWMITQFDAKADELQAIRGDIEVKREQNTRLVRVQERFDEVEPLVDEIFDILPTIKAQSEAVRQITSITNAVGLPLNSLDFNGTQGLPTATSQTEKSEVGGALYMEASFSTTASYEQLIRLLELFENSQRHTQVQNVSVIREDEGTLQANITIGIYLKP